jgi:hypothetical protein
LPTGQAVQTRIDTSGKSYGKGNKLMIPFYSTLALGARGSFLANSSLPGLCLFTHDGLPLFWCFHRFGQVFGHVAFSLKCQQFPPPLHRFMAAIEVITSQEREVEVTKVTGEKVKVLVRVWNETVSQLPISIFE